MNGYLRKMGNLFLEYGGIQQHSIGKKDTRLVLKKLGQEGDERASSL